MTFLRQLTQKPWAAAQARVDDLHVGGEFSLPTAKLGLRVFLGVATVLFSLLVVSYADRVAFADWRPIPTPWLLWLSTAILIVSSVALHWASVGADRGQMDVVTGGLLTGGITAVGFLASQLLAWQQLAALGYYSPANPAVAFFYLLTALHGLHLLGGLVAWGRTAAKVRRGVDLEQVRLSLELCATYWHFLLAVWLVLFGLLLFT